MPCSFSTPSPGQITAERRKQFSLAVKDVAWCFDVTPQINHVGRLRLSDGLQTGGHGLRASGSACGRWTSGSPPCGHSPLGAATQADWDHTCQRSRRCPPSRTQPTRPSKRRWGSSFSSARDCGACRQLRRPPRRLTDSKAIHQNHYVTTERRRPAAVASLRERDDETLPLHADDDVADAGPRVEPPMKDAKLTGTRP